MDKHQILKTYFGYDTFRSGQEDIIDSLSGGRDTLGVMPTGAGKSLCYQIPALLNHEKGITIVISPLISLMKDQVNGLLQNGIAAAYLNSSLSPEGYRETLRDVYRGAVAILYAAPERLLTERFLKLCEDVKIAQVIVDEAHCISQWGQNFRPSYLKITEFIERLPQRPAVGAFTATATGKVRQDIVESLKLQDPFILTTGFDRPNLYFGVEHPARKDDALLRLIRRRKDRSGIVYCGTRKNVEQVCELLQDSGFDTTRYHAGLEDAERRENQEDFLYDRKTIMVATNAFGMGIDKSNVSYVIHYNMPQSIEAYYQEAGRAGRDGEPADCILLYTPGDVRLNQFLIDVSEPNPDLDPEMQKKVKENDLELLAQMTFLATSSECLRGFMLNYFGEKAAYYCGNCSSCLGNFETVDITIEAQKILSCVYWCKESYGVKMICDVLRGSQNERLLERGLDHLSTYGLLKDLSEKRLRQMIEVLLQRGYLQTEQSEYPVLKLTGKSAAVLKGQERLEVKLTKEKQEPISASGRESIGGPVDETLLKELKALRAKLAKIASVPAFVIFSDATLKDICRKMPTTPEEFLQVSGVGEAKLKKYGKKFLKVIKAYRSGS